ncbi:helix-turn-helix domain-containing protein [uncultured Eubacterium sp.]|uniref:helix-turn-helix domain-containing protein n=1 Tax=uncultured Eubacterium sp. TaxID=165185 RepID=UPI0026173AFC|nr:helix-turn-helix transcriptional regulator [uncultured Eubacterium sp.]
MNQEKIGKFIAELRKENNMTQMELADKLKVTDRAISKWENGRGLPDVSLFEPLCKELNISINELLKGEKTKENNIEHLSVETMMSYNRYIKRKEKQKMFLLLIIIVIVLCTFLTMAILSFNKTFFETKYTSDFVSGVSIPIPKHSYYRGTGGMDVYTTKLKTLKQPDGINIFINRYLCSLEKVEYDNEIYYYDQENNFTILQYRINNDGIGFINTIYITYTEGRIES